MNDFLSKLSIYDQLGYLSVGGLFYIFLLYDQIYVSLGLGMIGTNSFTIAIAVYFLGHLAQAIPNPILALVKMIQARNVTTKPIYEELFEEIRTKVGYATLKGKLDDKQAFRIAYLYALTVDKTGRVEAMNARYGLLKGWACVLALQALASIGIYIYCNSLQTPNDNLLIMATVCVLLALIMAYWASHFFQQIHDKTINTYLLTKKDSLLPASK